MQQQHDEPTSGNEKYLQEPEQDRHQDSFDVLKQPLSNRSARFEKDPFYAKPAAYVLAVLVPIAGAVIGIIALAKGRIGPGLALIATSLVVTAVCWFVVWPLIGAPAVTKDLEAQIKTDLQSQAMTMSPGSRVTSMDCAVDDSYNGRCFAKVTTDGVTENLTIQVTGGSDDSYVWEVDA